jgi:hypothetical protein
MNESVQLANKRGLKNSTCHEVLAAAVVKNLIF